MKSKLLSIGLVLSMSMVFNSCMRGDSTCVKQSPINVKSTIQGLGETRASNTTWDAGDKVGIFMVKNTLPLSTANIVLSCDNIPYSTTGSNVFNPVSTSIYFPEDGSFVDFISYYPYTTPLLNYVYPINVVNQNPQKAIDLLYSGTLSKLSKASANVNFSFRHMLSKITMHMAVGSGIIAADLPGMVVNISGMNTQASFNLVTGEIVSPGSITDIKANVSTDGTIAEAIVIPGTKSGRKLTFTLVGGDSFTWNIPDTYEFPAGKETIYYVTMNRTGITVTSSIVPWGQANGTGENITAQ